MLASRTQAWVNIKRHKCSTLAAKGGGPCTSARRAPSRARALTSAKPSSHHEDTLGWAREEVTPHLQAYAARGHKHTHNVSLSSFPPHTHTHTHKISERTPLYCYNPNGHAFSMHDGKEEKNDHTGTRLFCKPSTQQLASDSISCRPDTPETPLQGASGPLTIKICSRFTALGAATRPDSPLRGRGRAVNSNRQLGWLRETREENTRITQVYTCTEGQNQQKGNKMAPKMKIKN